MIENMTKKDLKDRMVVETREGNRYLVCGNVIIRGKGYCNLSSYEENLLLTISSLSSLDIVKVYDIVDTLEDITNPNLPLIWERKHTPEIGDIYYDEDGNKYVAIIHIDDFDTVYPYKALKYYKDDLDSMEVEPYSAGELKCFKFIKNSDRLSFIGDLTKELCKNGTI